MTTHSRTRPIFAGLVSALLLTGLTTTAWAQQQEGAVQHTDSASPSRHLIFAPALSVNLGFSTQVRPSGETRETVHVGLSGGIAANLVLSPTTLGFVSGNLEIEHHSLQDGREVTYFMPMLHTGISMIGCHDEPGVASAMFPCAKFYGMAGVRPAPPGRPVAARVGLGFSSFFVPLAALSAGSILPSSYEVITKMDGTGSRLLMFRMGLGF